jgi:hypothetical protein
VAPEIAFLIKSAEGEMNHAILRGRVTRGRCERQSDRQRQSILENPGPVDRQATRTPASQKLVLSS